MKNERGVTLIELLIVILIMTSVSTVAFLLMDYTSKLERTVAEENELQREARFIMETFSDVIRDGGTVEAASGITLINENGQEQIVYDPAAGTIDFEPTGSTLSSHVDRLTVTKDADEGRYSIQLVLRSGSHSYEVATEIGSGAEDRIRY